MKKPPPIRLGRVRVHNLQAVDVELPSQKLIVFTGVSGSGKSSLAFDTLYVEGQRRYVESLSAFARKQIGELARPDLEVAEGITPTISIEQASSGRNPRSTIGTMTEIYDYLRILYAKAAIAYCPVSHEPVTPQSQESILERVMQMPEETRLMLMAPYVRDQKGALGDEIELLLRRGFMKARIDGALVSLEEEIQLDPSVSHTIEVVIDRVTILPKNRIRIAEGLTQALDLGKGLCIAAEMDTEAEIHSETLYSLHAYSALSGLSYPPLEPQDFSFNSPIGMCSHCQGLGRVNAFDLEKIIQPDLSIAEDCCIVASSYKTVRYGNIYQNLARIYGFSVDTPWKKLSEKAKNIFLYGTDKRYEKMQFVHPITGATWMDFVRWQGVLHEAMQRYNAATSNHYRAHFEPLLNLQICPHCKGSRLKPYPSAALLQGCSIQDITALSIEEALHFFKKITFPPSQQAITQDLLVEICARLEFLEKVGLDYLTLDRTAPTLSGGESQRVKLASQIGSGLIGMTYVLDEPSIGLHPRDNHALIETLHLLCQRGNTVVVVEHDEETMGQADWIVDFGPKAGKEGGEILYSGPIEGFVNVDSLTADYLTGRKVLALPKKRRKINKKRQIILEGASHHNLKNVRLELPLGLFVTVTGVSGSGKSSLILDTLHVELQRLLHHGQDKPGKFDRLLGVDQIDKVIAIDQSPIGRTPRSNPATYIKLLDCIRQLFSELPESKARGYGPGRFSFNVQEGSCTQCRGMGMIQMEMDFMEESWVTCPLCQGLRFDQETLSIRYKGKNIDDVLNMTVEEALEFFSAHSWSHKLETLHQVGLGYLTLGQSSTTLSGGEAQRIKLSRELTRPATGKTLYILDEPTTGLHFHDVAHLLTLLQALVDKGNSVVVIEHHIDVMRAADWIIDLGPTGGKGGGKILFSGPPELLAKEPSSTGKALKHSFETTPAMRLEEALRHRSQVKEIAAPFSDLSIEVAGAEQNCLKDLSLTIPRNQITFCVGPSGAGKSSLAFETLYAEAQRRYLESLSPYARQFVKQLPKPKVMEITGLSPAIAIEQKAHAGNPRSTVGTLTEIYDYFRILYSRLGIAHCPETGEVIRAIHKSHVAERILALPEGRIVTLLAPLVLRKQEAFTDLMQRLQKLGFTRIRLAGTFYQIEEPDAIPFDRKTKQACFLVIDRIKVGPGMRARLMEGLEQADKMGNGQMTFLHGEEEIFCNFRFSVESTGKAYPPITPHTFSFNSPSGMCPECQGLGVQYGIDLSPGHPFLLLTPAEIMRFFCGALSSSVQKLFQELLELEGISFKKPLSFLTPEQKKCFLLGCQAPLKKSQGLSLRWIGLSTLFGELAKNAHTPMRLFLTTLLQEHPCNDCQGSRLSPLARGVTLFGKSLPALCKEPIDTVSTFMEGFSIPESEGKALQEAYRQLITRLRFLKEVGLSYLTLHRTAPSLSGGEFQRIRLSRQLGAGLTGVLYVLDEPSTGLHPRDQERLIDSLKRLRDLHNTLVIVEQDPILLACADYFIELGPGGGRSGGELIASGTLEQLKQNPHSLTGPYLTGNKNVPAPLRRRSFKEVLHLKHAHLHTLKNLNLKIPLGLFCCVTGVSGSGKSTLVHDLLFPALRQAISQEKNEVEYKGATLFGASHLTRVIAVDQDPIGQTARSDVITYVEALAPLRDFFAALPEARKLGLEPKHFSYNHKKGMCTTCLGMGYRRVEMYFLPPLEVPCPACHGMRLNPLSLHVTYQEKNLGQWLQMSVEEAAKLLSHHPKLTRILGALIAVGLGYLPLGQEVATLSGGEAQRVKLAAELAKKTRGATLYLLDEPATGLHNQDLHQLLAVLHGLVDRGHSVIVIDHRLDIIQSADYLIELGPGAGDAGGYLVAEGTPEDLAKCKDSPTGFYLKEKFKDKIPQKAKKPAKTKKIG